jgi:class 3 adenylate cyclase
MERPARPNVAIEERRLLTVMFGDMVGSTPLSEAIGADSMHELLKLYQRACTQAVIDNDGVLVSWMGDGFMAHFGYPSRHEDAAVRAVEAGLGVVSAVKALGPELVRRFGVEITIRVGIHSGLVVVSRAPGREDDPHAVFFTGETTNIAARIESSAMPNNVSISEATWELVRGYFEVDALGPQQLRGLTRKVNTFRVRERTSARSRYFARSDRLTPLVGRADELRDLLEFAEMNLQGSSDFLGLTGEAGMGKTRLLDELVHQAGPSRDILYSACSPRDTTSPLHPFARLIRELIQPADRSSDVVFKSFASQIGPDVPGQTAMARLAALAGIEPPVELLPPDATPERVLQETSDAVREWLYRRGERGGTVVLVDDAQWLDPTSGDLLAVCETGLLEGAYKLLGLDQSTGGVKTGSEPGPVEQGDGAEAGQGGLDGVFTGAFGDYLDECRGRWEDFGRESVSGIKGGLAEFESNPLRFGWVDDVFRVIDHSTSFLSTSTSNWVNVVQQTIPDVVARADEVAAERAGNTAGTASASSTAAGTGSTPADPAVTAAYAVAAGWKTALGIYKVGYDLSRAMLQFLGPGISEGDTTIVEGLNNLAKSGGLAQFLQDHNVTEVAAASRKLLTTAPRARNLAEFDADFDSVLRVYGAKYTPEDRRIFSNDVWKKGRESRARSAGP